MPRLDRFTWAIVLGVVALVAAGIVVAIVADDRVVPPDLNTPGGVTLAYELALREGDYDAAWDLLASSLQASTPRNQFALRVSGAYSGSFQARSRLSVEAEEIQTSTAQVTLVRTFPSSGGLLGLAFDGSSSARYNVSLVREEGGWRISVPPEPYLLLPRGG